VLSRSRDIVPLGWIMQKLSHGQIPRRVAAITFDDGYFDVLENAKPILQHRDAPATVFLATGFLGSEFWWDRLARLISRPAEVPLRLDIRTRALRRTWSVLPSPARKEQRMRSNGSVTRGQLFHDLWAALRSMNEETRAEIFAILDAWSIGAAAFDPKDRAVSASEVGLLIAGGLVNIGAHTVSHPSLPKLDVSAIRHEIEHSKATCEALTGGAIDSFAFPFGDFDRATVAAVKHAGFSHSCSTVSGAAVFGNELFRLPRVTIENWPEETFHRCLARYH
jgi:peptidoglycan/xylan/chitin deacetylase (PgdA/CDA1 family)